MSSDILIQDQLEQAADHLAADRIDDALAIYQSILDDRPAHADTLNDMGLAYARQGKTNRATECFEQALQADPYHESAFFNLIDLLLETAGPEAAARVFDRYGTSIPSSPEKKEYADTLRSAPTPPQKAPSQKAPSSSDRSSTNGSDTLHVAFVCGSSRSFVTDIEREIGKRHEVRTAYFDESVNLKQIQDVIDWADATWFEWCDQILIHASHKLRKTSRVLCRLHSYEALSNMPLQVNWDFVDTLFIMPHILRILVPRLPDLTHSVTIESFCYALDLEQFPFNERSAGFDIAYVGYINHKKNPSLLLHGVHALVQHDDRYHLHVAGRFQQKRYENYWNHMLDVLDLADHVTHYGWADDISSWLDDKNYLLSASVLESFGYGITEAMARGIKPLIHNFPGANEIYRSEWLFASIPELVEDVTEGDYNSHRYRNHVAENFALNDQVEVIEQHLQPASVRSS